MCLAMICYIDFELNCKYTHSFYSRLLLYFNINIELSYIYLLLELYYYNKINK